MAARLRRTCGLRSLPCQMRSMKSGPGRCSKLLSTLALYVSNSSASAPRYSVTLWRTEAGRAVAVVITVLTSQVEKRKRLDERSAACPGNARHHITLTAFRPPHSCAVKQIQAFCRALQDHFFLFRRHGLDQA